MRSPFRAKFAGRCRHCGQAIPKGELILWAKGRGARHVACLKPGEIEGVPTRADFESLPRILWERQTAAERDRALVKRIQSRDFASGP